MDPQKKRNSNEIVGICPMCQSTHMRLSAEVVRTSEEGTLAHGPCPDCQSGMLILELGRDSFITSIGVLTELNRSEVERMLECSPITTEDVLDIHQALSERSVVKRLQSTNN